ncbi:MAG: hypothetical protein JW762_02845 [Dehalococcoidales bacterium]|nr:hypothetical protein [Dehalococcoidales bacterium]
MFNSFQYLKKSKGRRQKGSVLVLVLVMFLVGSSLCVILLQSSISGMLTGQVYENKAAELYAADAGIEDARWIIKYDYLDTFLTSPTYEYYKFSNDWTYSTSELINGENVTITIENVWIPVDIPAPSDSVARAIVEEEKLIITSANGSSSYNIIITYFPEVGDDLKVESIGVWLPRGFRYVSGSSNMEPPFTDNITVVSHAGNEAVIWNFTSEDFDNLPGVNPANSPRVAEITFQLDSELSDTDPDTVAWISTSNVADIPFSWESDVKVYKATSIAGTTAIEAWMAKSETRLLSGGIAGDYIASGNSLMIDADHDGQFRDTLLSESSANVSEIPVDATVRAAYLYWTGWRNGVEFYDTCNNFDNWNNGSAWSISSSRFRGHYSSGIVPAARTVTLNESVNLSGFIEGDVKVMWNQSEYGTLESGDKLWFAFSSDNGSSWGGNIKAFENDNPASTFEYDIPQACLTENFSMRFYIEGFDGYYEYCYIDTITVTTSEMIPDTSIEFKIDGNQVYFAGDGTPTMGAEKIVAGWSDSMENFIGATPEGYSYVCFKDVTALVKAFSPKAPDPAINHPGNAVYTVGDVAADTISTGYTSGSESYLAYAGWSMVIIYSSAETQGHSLYLYDTFLHCDGNQNFDFDQDGSPGGTITKFLVPEPVAGEVNAAKMTVFVGEGDDGWTGDYLKFNGTKFWDGTNSNQNNAGNPNNCWNGMSLGMTADGVDVDTFYVTWASGLLMPGHTTAQIDLETGTDEWSLIYIILSFRDETRTGDALSYLINE